MVHKTKWWLILIIPLSVSENKNVVCSLFLKFNDKLLLVYMIWPIVSYIKTFIRVSDFWKLLISRFVLESFWTARWKIVQFFNLLKCFESLCNKNMKRHFLNTIAKWFLFIEESLRRKPKNKILFVKQKIKLLLRAGLSCRKQKR